MIREMLLSFFFKTDQYKDNFLANFAAYGPKPLPGRNKNNYQ